MKIGFFTDSHYSTAEITCGNRYNSRSLEKIRAAMAWFASQGCGLVICLGDLIDREACHEQERENLRQVAAVLDASPVETICVMGNHDGFAFTREEFYGILGECRRPRTLRAGAVKLVFLDACWFADGRPYGPGDTDWTDTCLPHPETLERELAALEGPCWVLLHQNLDPEIRPDHRLRNDELVRQLLRDSGKVRKVLQGHYHPGHCSVHQGIEYRTFPALCERETAWEILTA